LARYLRWWIHRSSSRSDVNDAIWACGTGASVGPPPEDDEIELDDLRRTFRRRMRSRKTPRPAMEELELYERA